MSENDFTTYQNFINELSKRVIPSDEYIEHHHILPKCLGGTDDIDNIIVVTPEEHYWLHYLLFKEHPTNSKLAYAWHIMSNREGQYLSDVEYSKMRKQYAKLHSSKIQGKNHPGYLNRESDETRDKISKHHADVSGCNHPLFSKKKAAKSVKQQVDHSITISVRCVETGEVYKTCADAAKAVGAFKENIYAVIRGKNKTCQGFHWEKVQTNYPSTIKQYDILGNYVAEYSSLKEAAQAVNGSSSNICKCCNGQAYSAYGYCWSR